MSFSSMENQEQETSDVKANQLLLREKIMTIMTYKPLQFINPK